MTTAEAIAAVRVLVEQATRAQVLEAERIDAAHERNRLMGRNAELEARWEAMGAMLKACEALRARFSGSHPWTREYDRARAAWESIRG